MYFQFLNWVLANSYIMFRLALPELARKHLTFGQFKLEIFQQLMQRAEVEPVSLNPILQRSDSHLPVFVGKTPTCAGGCGSRVRYVCLACERFVCLKCFTPFHLQMMSKSDQTFLENKREQLMLKLS